MCWLDGCGGDILWFLPVRCVNVVPLTVTLAGQTTLMPQQTCSDTFLVWFLCYPGRTALINTLPRIYRLHPFRRLVVPFNLAMPPGCCILTRHAIAPTRWIIERRRRAWRTRAWRLDGGSMVCAFFAFQQLLPGSQTTAVTVRLTTNACARAARCRCQLPATTTAAVDVVRAQ